MQRTCASGEAAPEREWSLDAILRAMSTEA
jgi:hypothetical protein